MNDSKLFDKVCENAVLQELIFDAHCWNDVQLLLSDGCFYDEVNNAVFKCIKNMHNHNEPVNVITLVTELHKDKRYSGIGYVDITNMYDSSARPAQVELYQYCSHLKELELRRIVFDLSVELRGIGSSETGDVASSLEDVRRRLDKAMSDGVSPFKELRDIFPDLYDKIRTNTECYARGVLPERTQTGFRLIDERGGFQRGDLIVVAAESSMGKSSLALNMAYNAASAGCPLAVYSLEMTNIQLAARMAACISGIPASKILYEPFTEKMTQDYDMAVGILEGLPIYFDDSSTSSITHIIASIRSMKSKYDIGGAVIDYLQILSLTSNIRGANKEQLIADATRSLKNLAKELGIWIMVLSQLNRNMEHPEPTIDRLRDSGQIAEAADDVILIWRPEMRGKEYTGEFSNVPVSGTAMLHLCKGRNIGVGKCIVRFNPELTKFTDDYDINQTPY